MESKGFNENGISERSREALQSETCAESQEVKSTGKEKRVPEEGTAEEAGSKSIQEKVKEKLEEMKAGKDKAFAETVTEYLQRRCEEDYELAQCVLQEHKTWQKCVDFLHNKASKQAVNNKACIREDVVFGWAEDYFRKDDKAEEERKAKEAEERKKKEAERKKKAAERKNLDRKDMKAPASKDDRRKPDGKSEPMKKSKEVDGQMDIFSIMGM